MKNCCCGIIIVNDCFIPFTHATHTLTAAPTYDVATPASSGEEALYANPSVTSLTSMQHSATDPIYDSVNVCAIVS